MKTLQELDMEHEPRRLHLPLVSIETGSPKNVALITSHRERKEGKEAARRSESTVTEQ